MPINHRSRYLAKCFDGLQLISNTLHPTLLIRIYHDHFLFDFEMNLMTLIWTIVSSSWDCISHHAEYISDLEEKSSSLKQALNELKGMHEDLETKVALVRENPHI